LQKSYIVYTTI